MKKHKGKIGNNIFLLSFFIFVFLIGSASAEQQTLGWIKTNSCVSLKQSYGNSTFQNVTAVTLPDKTTVYIINSGMTSLGGGLYNYSFCNNTQSGQYIVDGIGDVDGKMKTWSYDYNASPLGFSNTFIFYLIFILIIVLIFLFGFKLENVWVMSLGSILLLIFGLFVVANGIDLIKDTKITWAIGLVIWALGILSMYLSVEEQLKNWR